MAFEGVIHPVAALFPMMSDDELADLATDIKANGQIHPIVLDAEGQLIDGRNRLAACRLAEVEPRFAEFDGADPVAFIISANVNRRHLSKGQQAMAVARALKETLKATDHALAVVAGTSHQRIHQANVVLRYAPALSDAVLAGASLDEAYAIAQERKRALDDDAANLQALKRRQPALAAQVEAGALTVGEAVAASRAIERTAAEEAEIARLRQAIQLAHEEIGTPVPLPEHPPSIDYRLVADQDGAVELPKPNAPGELTRLRAEEAFLRELIAVRNQMTQVVARADLEGSGWSDGTVKGVRSAASTIIAAAYEMVKRHEQAIQGAASIRSVK